MDVDTIDPLSRSSAAPLREALVYFCNVLRNSARFERRGLVENFFCLSRSFICSVCVTLLREALVYFKEVEGEKRKTNFRNFMQFRTMSGYFGQFYAIFATFTICFNFFQAISGNFGQFRQFYAICSNFDEFVLIFREN